MLEVSRVSVQADEVRGEGRGDIPFGKSFGFFISAMNDGSVICPTNVYVMFRKADMPATYVVPLTGMTVTSGSSPGTYPNGWSWMPEKMIARRTAIPMVTALNVPSPESCESGRGSETRKQTQAEIALKATVHTAEFVSVFSTFAPTRQWSPVGWEKGMSEMQR